MTFKNHKFAYKAAVGAVGILVLIGILFAGASVYLDSRHARNLLLTKINQRIPGTVDWKRARVAPLRGVIELNDFRLQGPTRQHLADIDRLLVNFSWIRLLQGRLVINDLRIVGPNLTIEMDENRHLDWQEAFERPSGRTEPSGGGLPVKNILIEHMRVSDGRIAFRSDPKAGPLEHLTVEGLDFTLTDANWAKQRFTARLRASKIQTRYGSETHVFTGFDFSASYRPQMVDNLKISASSAGVDLDIAGSIRNPTAPRPDLGVDIRLAGDLGTAAAKWRPDLQITGGAGVQLRIDGDPDNPKISGVLNYNGGRLGQVPIDATEVRFGLADRRILLEKVSTRLPWGAFLVKGTVDLQKTFPKGFLSTEIEPAAVVYDLSLMQKNFSLQSVFHNDPSITGILSTSAKLKGNGFETDGMSMAFEIETAAENLGVRGVVKPGRFTLTGSGAFSEGELRFDHIRGNGPGFGVETSGVYRVSSGVVSASVAAAVKNFSSLSLGDNLSPVGGVLNLQGRIGGTLSNPEAEIRIRGDHLSTADVVLGDIDAQLEWTQQGIARISDLTLKNNDTTIHAAGSVDLMSNGRFSGNPALDLSAEFQDAAPADFVKALPLEGAYTGKLTVKGALKSAVARLRITGHSPRFESFHADEVSADMHYEKGAIRVADARVRRNGGVLTLEGKLDALNPETLRPNPAPHFEVRFSSTSLQLADFNDRVKGTAKMSGRLEGTFADMHGTMAASAEDLLVAGQRFAGVDLDISVDGKTLYANSLVLRVQGAETIRASGWATLDGAYHIETGSRGISLNAVAPFKSLDFQSGKAVFNFSGDGRFRDPRLSGTLALKNLAMRSTPLSDAVIDWSLENGKIELAGKTDFALTGNMDLSAKTFRADLVFDETKLDRYFQLAGQQEYAGLIGGRMQLRGSVDRLRAIKGEADISQLLLRKQGTEVLRTSPFHLSIREAAFSVRDLLVTILESGKIDVSGEGAVDGKLDFKVKGELPAAVISRFTDAVSDVTGNIRIQATATGSLEDPNVSGKIDIAGIGMTLPEAYAKIHDVDGRVRISNRAITIESLVGRIGDGRFTANGNLRLDRFRPTDIEITLSGREIPVEIPGELKLTLDPQLTFEGVPDHTKLSGSVVMVSGTYYKDVKLKLLERIRTRKRERSAETTTGPNLDLPYLKDVALDVSLTNRAPFMVNNNIALLSIRPDFNLEGTLENSLLTGRATVTQGTIYYQKKEFEVTKGVVDFINPYVIEPTIDVTAVVDIRQWHITLTVSGTPDNLKFTLASNPSESYEDILSLLVLGKTTAELSGGGGGSASPTAMLANLLANRFREDVSSATGIDVDLQVKQGETTSDGENVNITLGKELSRRLSVKSNMEIKKGEVVQRASGEYKILENFLIHLFQDTKGDFGGEFVFRMEFR